METPFPPAPDEARTAEVLIAALAGQADARCASCQAGLCGHQVLMNIVLGFRDAPRCLTCLAIALDKPRGDLRDTLIGYVNARECYRTAWEWTSRREGTRAEGVPACLLAFEAPSEAGSTAVRTEGERPRAGVPAVVRTDNADAEWDAGDMGCGDLVLELRGRLGSMPPGRVLKLTARDRGAAEDLPAWCRLTGHALVREEPPIYWIKRKE